MANPMIHVQPAGDGWLVRRDGGDELSHHRTQEEAAEEGRRIARQEETELVLHGADGRIREKDSYGNDPRDIPG